jgi:hypothetical protein
MSFTPDKWGPPAWKTIHVFAMAYPTNPNLTDKQNYKKFFYSLGNVIPCSICREHYLNHLENIPITDDVLSSRLKLLYWTIDLHNAVNKLNGKPTYDYETAIELIKQNQECSLITSAPTPQVNIDRLLDENTKLREENEKLNILLKIPNSNVKLVEEISNDTKIDNTKIDNIKPDNTKPDNTKYILIFLFVVCIVMFLWTKNKK